MVSPSSVTPSRRVTRSQCASDREANPKKIPRLGKTASRYAVSSTESELEEPASTDQEEAASTEQEEAASTEPEFIITTPTFPERLFARNCYPGKPRLNIYSKASIIGSLVKLLRGSPEMNCLLESQFGALFHLLVSRCSNSAKLVHSLLSRQLVTMRLYELWFLFADKPLRFSLREFGDITGLKCEPEREKVGNGSESIDATPGRMWKELFETEDEDVTVPDVLRMLEQPSLPEWKRLPLALIALVDGLLQSTTCYGFPLELQLFAFKAIPSLLEKIPEPNKTTSFVQEPEGCDSTNALLNFEDILLVETQTEVIVTYSIPDEGGDPNSKQQTLEECQKPSRRFGKACDEPGSSTQAPQRPIRPRRWICKQAGPGNLSDKGQELKEGGSFTVPQNTAAGKTNRDNSHADPTGMEGPKKRRPFSGDGNDEAEIFWSDSKKHKKNNGDGFSDDETMRMHDNHCDGYSMAGEGPSFSKSANIPEVDVSTPIGPEIVSKPAKPTLPEPLEVFSVDYPLFVLVSEVYRNTDLFGQGEGGDESPISGLNLMLTVWSHPESYVLPPEEQGGKASPTNSEDYKTPPEDDPMTECCTPDLSLSRYLTRSLKKAELEGKCIPISSTKIDDFQTKRIPRRSTKIGGQTSRKRNFKSFSQFSARNRHSKLEFEIVIGIHVSNKFFLSLARPTNWVSTEFAEFEKASDKLGFNWGGLVSFSFTGKMPRRNDKKVLLVDMDRVYAPMMWGKDHWVGLVINLTCRQVKILDCNIPLNESDNEVNKHMAYLLRALPHVLAVFSPPSDSSHPEEDQAFSWVRPDNIYFKERSGDCGPCAVKFLEMHAAGYSYEDMGQIDDKKVDIIRQKYAMDTYEEFIGNAKVQNDG
ncbi:unnamed protein product [Brassica oleracea]